MSIIDAIHEWVLMIVVAATAACLRAYIYIVCLNAHVMNQKSSVSNKQLGDG